MLADVQALENSIVHGEAGSSLYQLMSDFAMNVNYCDGKELALLQRAVAGWVLHGASAELNEIRETLPISLVPPADAGLRRAKRVLAMVLELHKAGYQRLRIAPGISPCGAHWLCCVMAAEDVLPNGWEPAVWGGFIARYSTADVDRFFDWDDSPGMNARQLAHAFVERFPDLASKGAGQDRAYAGWFVSMLGRAENGRLPVFFADYEIGPGEEEMPPPPGCGISEPG